MLSINFWNILWTVINVLILCFLIKKFLFKPVHKILEQRKEEIAKTYADSEKTRTEAEALKTQYEDALNGLDEDRKKSVAEARREAREKSDRILTDAHVQADKIIEDARKKGQAAADQEMRKGEEAIADMVRSAAAKIVNSTSNEQMFDDFLKEVENSELLGSLTGKED